MDVVVRIPVGIARSNLTSSESVSLWKRTNSAPLAPFLDVHLGGIRYRIGSPNNYSYLCSATRWVPLAPAEIADLIKARVGDTVDGHYILANANDPDAEIGPLTTATRAFTLAKLTSWLGWPDCANAACWPISVAEYLTERSNDYWLLDLTAHLILKQDAVSGHMKIPNVSGGVSVVMPARSVHSVLPEVLRSLVKAAQKLPNGTQWECIVVDDANEPPLQIPPKLPPEVHIIRSDRQLHCGGARNLGLANAKFDITIFCDADTHMAPNYLMEHCARHVLSPNVISVSLREYLHAAAPLPRRKPCLDRDSRIEAKYGPERLGLIRVPKPVVVRPLNQTFAFRDFGHGRTLGPIDLPFMVKGNNLGIRTRVAREVGFPANFVGWGPEDVCFASKCIARGAFVVPVLSTGVFHIDHEPRSGSKEAQNEELVNNLKRYSEYLASPITQSWL